MKKSKYALALKILKMTAFLFSLFLIVVFLSVGFLQFTEEDVVFLKDKAANIMFSPLVQIVPSAGLPAGLNIQNSNNNLDLVKYRDRYYFAFRSAPTHFASPRTILYVLSSADARKWELETKFQLGSDAREPRFLVFKDKLFLYFFKGGSNMLSFEPDRMFVTQFEEKSKWSEIKQVYKPGYVVWRVKEHKGEALMSVYYGAGLYSNVTEPGHLQLISSKDGVNYSLLSGKDVLSETSAEEGEFEFDKDGNLYSTVRLERFGGKVCYAREENITAWDCNPTNYKFDSAIMFRRGEDFYVIARRNVAGPYNRNSTIIPKSIRSHFYLVRYSLTRKRTALYYLNKEKRMLQPIFDFPSCGDTAYAGMVQMSKNKYLVYNYSTDINGFDWSWIGGQLKGSNIYSTTLEFKN